MRQEAGGLNKNQLVDGRGVHLASANMDTCLRYSRERCKIEGENARTRAGLEDPNDTKTDYLTDNRGRL